MENRLPQRPPMQKCILHINVANYTGHEGVVRAVDWSHDGRYLATATVGMTDRKALIHYARFEEDLLPIARRQLERGREYGGRAGALFGGDSVGVAWSYRRNLTGDDFLVACPFSLTRYPQATPSEQTGT